MSEYALNTCDTSSLQKQTNKQKINPSIQEIPLSSTSAKALGSVGHGYGQKHPEEKCLENRTGNGIKCGVGGRRVISSLNATSNISGGCFLGVAQRTGASLFLGVQLLQIPACWFQNVTHCTYLFMQPGCVSSSVFFVAFICLLLVLLCCVCISLVH